MTQYTTKATWLGNEYGCRVYNGDRVVVEARVKTRDEIGPAFRDLLRTLDKLGGDAFTSAARVRKYKEGNKSIGVNHYWGGKK
jgi:hypothetical protein